MVTGDDQPAAMRTSRHLNPVAGSRAVPGPIVFLHAAGDHARRRPRLAFVLTGNQQHVVVVSSHRQPDHSRVAIHHRAGVADRDLLDATFLVDQIHRSPVAAAVGAAPRDQIDIAMIGSCGP